MTRHHHSLSLSHTLTLYQILPWPSQNPQENQWHVQNVSHFHQYQFVSVWSQWLYYSSFMSKQTLLKVIDFFLLFLSLSYGFAGWIRQNPLPFPEMICGCVFCSGKRDVIAVWCTTLPPETNPTAQRAAASSNALNTTHQAATHTTETWSNTLEWSIWNVRQRKFGIKSWRRQPPDTVDHLNIKPHLQHSQDKCTHLHCP